MSALAKSARSALKEKARRLAGETTGKVDSTSTKVPAAFTAEKKAGLQPTARRAFKKGGAVKKEAGGSLPPPEEAAQSEARLKNVRVGNKTSSRGTLPPPAEAAASAARVGDSPAKRAGGRTAKKGGGGLTVINIGGKEGGAAAPVAPPPPPVAAPMPMPAPAAPGGQPPMMQKAGFKKGGRIAKVAASYKDMKAGAGTGEGRLQKTSIAKKGKGAPKA